MISKRITAADLASVTGFSRHKLRAFMKELPGYSGLSGQERIAREYTRQDLLVIAISCALETRCGLRRDVIAALVADIHRAVAGPRTIAVGAALIVQAEPPQATYASAFTAIREGTVLALDDIFGRVDMHLSGGREIALGGQFYLDLGPVPVYGSARGRRPAKKGA